MTKDSSFSINICGYLQAELGVGEVGRILARAADHAGINYSTLTSTRTLNRQNFGFQERTSGESAFINLIAINADQMKIWAQDVGAEVVEGRYNIGVWSWELEDFPEIFDEAFSFVDEIWANSEFTQRAISKRTSKPVLAVPFHVETKNLAAIEKLDRVPLGILPNDEYFLFMCDFLSDLDRKNPLGLIEAFKIAFAPNSGPKLIVKTINGEVRREDLETVRRATDNRADIIVYDGYLDKSQRTALIAECLSYVSLHRSEGYGLTMAEAMSLSKPVIATGYSANCEFMSSDDSLLIPFELVSTKGNPTYPYDSHWAAPNIGSAAESMRKVFKDRIYSEIIGGKGLVAQQKRASVHNTSTFMLGRVTEIYSMLEEKVGLELAVPEGWLYKLTRSNELSIEDLRVLINASHALSHSVLDLSGTKSSNFLVRLSRKILARVNAPFEQYERLRHQSHVGVNSALLDELKFRISEIENLNRAVQNSRLLSSRILNQFENLKNQNAALKNKAEALDAIVKDLGTRIDLSNSQLQEISSRIRALPYIQDPNSFDLRQGTDWTIGFDNTEVDTTPLHLVDLFRPTETDLISNLRRYQEFFPTKGLGIDLGCGRGEMLKVMNEGGLDPFGIDSDQVCIDQCLKAGFRTKKIDISSFLRNESAHSCDLVTAIHVVEHVGYDDLIGWLRDIFRILKSDGVFILETPNPHAVDAFKAFWVDPTHIRPYYPESLLAILQEVGFRRAHVEVQGEQTAVQDRLEFAGSYSIVARK